MKSKLSTCGTCGHRWPTGTDGHHSCEHYLGMRIAWLEKGCREIIHEAASHVEMKRDGSEAWLPPGYAKIAVLAHAHLGTLKQAPR